MEKREGDELQCGKRPPIPFYSAVKNAPSTTLHTTQAGFARSFHKATEFVTYLNFPRGMKLKYRPSSQESQESPETQESRRPRSLVISIMTPCGGERGASGGG